MFSRNWRGEGYDVQFFEHLCFLLSGVRGYESWIVLADIHLPDSSHERVASVGSLKRSVHSIFHSVGRLTNFDSLVL